MHRASPPISRNQIILLRDRSTRVLTTFPELLRSSAQIGSGTGGRPLDRKCDVATWRHPLQPRAGTAGQQPTSIHCIVSAHAYVDRSGCIKSSLVGDGVAELEWISSVPVKVAVVNVHRLNDGEAISSWNAVAWWWVAIGRTLLLHRLITQPSSQICTIQLALKEHFRKTTVFRAFKWENIHNIRLGSFLRQGISS